MSTHETPATHVVYGIPKDPSEDMTDGQGLPVFYGSEVDCDDYRDRNWTYDSTDRYVVREVAPTIEIPALDLTTLPRACAREGIDLAAAERAVSAETCERCGEPAECVATIGRDWSERQCETCALLSADKGHYVRYDSGPEENA